MTRRAVFHDSGVLDDGNSTLTPSGIGAQPLDSDLTAIAALSTTSFGRSLLALADAAALRTTGGLGIGTDVEAHDTDLTTIAGLSPSNDDVIQRKAGAWTNRTMAQLASDLGVTTFDLAAAIHAATSKTTPVDNDELALVDSAASNALKKLLWSNVKATLATYFDTRYAATGSGGLGAILYDYTVTGSDKASIDTQVDDGGNGAAALPTSYRFMRIFFLSRTDAAGATQGFDMIVNNDGAGANAHYDLQYVYGSNATAAAGAGNAQDKWAFDTHGSGGTASYASLATIDIPFYADTNFFKNGTCQEARLDNLAGNQLSLMYAIGYRSTTAITRVKFACQSTNKFKVGSRLLIVAW